MRPASRTSLVLSVLVVLAAACGVEDTSGYGRTGEAAAPEPGDGQDLGLFSGRPMAFADGYAPRSNVVQTVASPIPEGGWGGDGWVFVANEVGRGLSVLDLRTLTPVAWIYSPDSEVPHHPYLSPDQRWVSVNTRFGNEVLVVDTHDGLAVTPLAFPESADGDEVAGPLHGTYTSDSRYFLVALQRSGRLGVVDLEAPDGPAIAEVIDLGDRPRDVYITPDDAKAFVSMQGEAHVAVVDLDTWEVREIARSDADYRDAGGAGAGMSVDGTRLAVANTPEDEIVVIDTASEEVIERVGDIPMPVNVEYLGDTHVIGTGNRSDGSVTFVDGEAGRILQTVETGGGANIPYLGPDGRYWVSHNGADHLSVLNAETFEVVDEVRTGVNPHWIHFLPSGSRALVTNWGEDTISVIDTVRRRELVKVRTGLNPNGITVKTDVTTEQARRALAEGGEAGASADIEMASEMVLPEPRDERETLFLDTCVQCHDIGRIVRNTPRVPRSGTTSSCGWRATGRR
jgi:YVTN family beta-propeller protein